MVSLTLKPDHTHTMEKLRAQVLSVPFVERSYLRRASAKNSTIYVKTAAKSRAKMKMRLGMLLLLMVVEGKSGLAQHVDWST